MTIEHINSFVKSSMTILALIKSVIFGIHPRPEVDPAKSDHGQTVVPFNKTRPKTIFDHGRL